MNCGMRQTKGNKGNTVAGNPLQTYADLAFKRAAKPEAKGEEEDTKENKKTAIRPSGGSEKDTDKKKKNDVQ